MKLHKKYKKPHLDLEVIQVSSFLVETMKTKLVFGGIKKHGKIVIFLWLTMWNYMETLYLQHFKSI